MHIAVVSLGAFGHVNPTLELVTELVRRGVRVTYFCTEGFRTIVEPTGARFVAVPSWMEAHAGESGEDKSDVAATVPFLFLHEAQAYLEPVLAVLKEDHPVAIVHDFAGIAGTLAADVLGVPNVMLYTSYPANGEYSVAAGFETVSPDHPLRVAADELADRFVAQYGCRKMTVKEIFDGRGGLNLVMMQKRLVPHNESFDDSFVFTGVQIGKRTAFGSWKAPHDGKPLLYSSMGTAFNNWPEYYPILFDAVRDLDIHVFAALGSIDPASLQDVPANVELGQMVPQLDILSQASVFITHAGMWAILPVPSWTRVSQMDSPLPSAFQPPSIWVAAVEALHRKSLGNTYIRKLLYWSRNRTRASAEAFAPPKLCISALNSCKVSR